MQFAVSRSQAEGWKHPLVQKVEEALTGPCHYDFKAKIRDIILSEGLMTPFLSMPFTAGSSEGQRLAAVLEELKKEFPQREMMRTFWWKFWDPERDEREAHFMFGAIQQEPVMVGARVA